MYLKHFLLSYFSFSLKSLYNDIIMFIFLQRFSYLATSIIFRLHSPFDQSFGLYLQCAPSFDAVVAPTR